MDVDIIEADVRLTKDGIPIIRHDALLDRTCNVNGYVWDYQLAEFESNIRLESGELVPTLEDFCIRLKNEKPQLYIDLKTFDAEAIVLSTCLKYLKHDQFYIGSFNADCIKRVKQMDPNCRTILIMEESPFDMTQIISDVQCDVLALGFHAINSKDVEAAHASNIKVFTWTVNHPSEIERAKGFNVDGITSDYPDRI